METSENLSSYSTIITEEIAIRNRQLIDEHRAWRALELQHEIKGLARALELYYMYGFNSSQPTIKEEQ